MISIVPTLRLFLSFAAAAITAAPATAQSPVIVHGHGSYIGANQELKVSSFAAVGHGDGRAVGHFFGYEPSTGGQLGIRIESYVTVDDMVVLAGTVQLVVNAPFVLGGNVFFVVRDGQPDEFAGVGMVPAPFAPLTASEIVGLIGTPPPNAFAPLLTGNIAIR